MPNEFLLPFESQIFLFFCLILAFIDEKKKNIEKWKKKIVIIWIVVII